MIRIKTLYFLVAFILVVVLANFLGQIQLNNAPEPKESETLEELTSESFSNMPKDTLIALLVYDKDFNFYKKMEYTVYHSSENENIKTCKIDINNFPDSLQISGTPTLLFYKNGKEQKRVMGIIPESNLRMIIKRLE